MTLVQKSEEIQQAIGQVKAASSQFRTNFFPPAGRVEDWIRRGCLFMEKKREAVFLFRPERDFWRLYFAAANLSALGNETASQMAPSRTCRMVLDLLGKETDLLEMANVVGRANWNPYQRLMRLALIGAPLIPEGKSNEKTASAAEEQDETGIERLIEERFDPLTDQIPTADEIRTARKNGQILIWRERGRVAALLFFETTGFTSTIRYWAVGQEFESRGFGSSLLRTYLRIHATVKRFVLWVNEKNENAIQKYQRFGYQPDGLKDQILIKDFARA